MMTPKRSFFFGFLLAIVLAVGLGIGVEDVLAQALQGDQLFGTGGFGEQAGLGEGDIRVTIARIIRTVLGFLGVIAVLIVIYGGFVWMTAAGSDERVAKAKRILINGAIGLVIVLSSFAITQFVLNALTDATTGTVTTEGPGPGGGPYPDGGGSGDAFVLLSANNECAAELPRNYRVELIFSKNVDFASLEQTVPEAELGIWVTRDDTPVEGRFAQDPFNRRKIFFDPLESCGIPELPNERCFVTDDDYEIVLRPLYLQSTGGQAIECSGSDCVYPFAIGTEVDTVAPTLTIDNPEDGAALIQGLPESGNVGELIQTFAADDFGVGSVDFIVEGEEVYSTATFEAVPGSQDRIFRTDTNEEWDTIDLFTNQVYDVWAEANDCGGNSASAERISIVLRAPNCANGVQDVELGELGECSVDDPERCDCGGNPSSEFYCGICPGDQCVADIDCASGVCENGVCVTVPKITSVSPGDGAPGNYVTILGGGFGDEPGSVVMHDVSGEVALVNPECSGFDQWFDDQITVVVPAGVTGGPIEVRTLDGDFDRTDDAYGPFIADFVVNDVVRPGLCAVTPATQIAGQTVRLLGTNFDPDGDGEQGTGTVFFSNFLATQYDPLWQNEEVVVTVPQLLSRDYLTQIFVGDNVCSLAPEKFCSPLIACEEGEGECVPCEGCLFGREGSNKLKLKVQSLAIEEPPLVQAVNTGWRACSGGNNATLCVSDADCGADGTCVDAPTFGPHGQYVSIVGSNFGNARGFVKFVDPDTQIDDTPEYVRTALGDPELAEACGEGIWTDTQILVKVPAEYASEEVTEAFLGSHRIFVQRQEDGAQSNQFDFEVLGDQTPGPAVCEINPSSGPTGTPIDIFGENLGDNDGTLTFFSGQVVDNTGYAGWDDLSVTNAVVPTDAETGPVFATNATGSVSNPINFQVFDCRENNNTCLDGALQCCGDGTCQAVCPDDTVASHFVYRFSTGPIPRVPRVKVECSEEDLGGGVIVLTVSPTPWEGWGERACLDSPVVAVIDTPVEATSINDDLAVEVQECVGPAEDPCSVLADESDSHNFNANIGPDSTVITWQPTVNYTPDATYQVTLASTIRAEDQGTPGLDDFIPGAEMGQDFVFRFVADGADVSCTADRVAITPSESTIIEEGTDGIITLGALPAAAGRRCTLMACEPFDWAWASNDITKADIDSTTPDGCYSDIIGIDETFGAPVQIGAVITGPATSAGVSGAGLVNVDFTDPKVKRRWPDCGDACINAGLGATFNTKMMPGPWVPDTHVRIYECPNQLCDASLIGAGVNQVSIIDTIDYTEPDGSDPRIDIALNQTLVADQFYRVVIDGVNVVSLSDVELGVAGANNHGGFDGHYSWVFRTRAEAVECAIDHIDMVPPQSIVKVVGERAAYKALPVSAPDECSPDGQILQDSYVWSTWNSIDDPNTGGTPLDEVAVMLGLPPGELLISSDLPPYCTPQCLKTGSLVTNGTPLCGNGIVEVGEDCDDNFEIDGDGCSSRCLHEGATADNPPGSCGNDIVEAGEDCDPGRHCENGNACDVDNDCTDGSLCEVRGQDACSAECLNLGSRSLEGAVCGNGGTPEYLPDRGGEDCDDGNTRSGDGCSSQCVNEGTTSESMATAVGICGDGIVQAGEDCDGGLGCSDRCLNTGTNACQFVCQTAGGGGSLASCTPGPAACLQPGETCQPLAQPCCGDGSDDPGEDAGCDAGNGQVAPGCSAQCLNTGSSLELAAFCGSAGALDPGEECEAAAPGSIGPFGVAEALLTASNEVDLDTRLATARVETSAQGVTGEAVFGIECSCTGDAFCGDSAVYGCGAGSCCYQRPEINFHNPADNPVNPVCRNASIYVEFTEKMDRASLDPSADNDGDGVIAGAELRPQLYLELVNVDTNGDGNPDTPVDATSCEEAGGQFAMRRIDDQGFFARTWGAIKRGVRNLFGFRGARAQAGIGCITDVDYKLEDTTIGGSRVRLVLQEALAPGADYRLMIKGEDDGTDNIAEGVLSIAGVGVTRDMSPSGEYIVNFQSDTEICTLDFVDAIDEGRIEAVENGDPIDPSPGFFTTSSEQHLFRAAGFAVRQNNEREEIQPIPGVYDWTWSWSVTQDGGVDILDVTQKSAPEEEQAYGQSLDQDGKVTMLAVATITEDDPGTPEIDESEIVTGQEPVVALLCTNPVFFDDVGTAAQEGGSGVGPTNFAFYYCADGADPESAEDDLPVLEAVDVPAPLFGILKEFLYVNKQSGDAMGIRVISNPDYLTPQMYYEARGFGGATAQTLVDGYEAVRDRNTLYVFAPNHTGDIFPNIYVISFNDDASPESLAIFDQILNNWEFNANSDLVTDWNVCRTSTGDVITDESGTVISCNWNGDCSEQLGAFCDARKAKLRRDTKRLSDLVRMRTILEDYSDPQSGGNRHCEITKAQSCNFDFECPGTELCIAEVPDLAEGSFIRAMSTSKWPSWSAGLGNATGQAFPTDPLNAFLPGSCPADFDQESCYDANTSQFVCGEGSYLYGYRSIAGERYELTAQLEYDLAPWFNAIDNDPNDNATLIAEYAGAYSGPALDGGGGESEGVSPAQYNAVYLGAVNTAWSRGYLTYIDSRFQPESPWDTVCCGTDVYNRDLRSLGSDEMRNGGYDFRDGYLAGDAAEMVAGLDRIEAGMDIFTPYAEGRTMALFDSGTPVNDYLNPQFSDLRAAIADARASLVPGASGITEGLREGFFLASQMCNGQAQGISTVCGDGIKGVVNGDAEECELGEVFVDECGSGQIALNCIDDEGTCRFETEQEALDRGGECVAFSCGNGVKDPGEECDDGPLNGTYGQCGADCNWDFEAGLFCGNGFLEAGEECDCGDPDQQSEIFSSSETWANLGNNCQTGPRGFK